MKTLRDAEQKIKQLERDLESVRSDLRRIQESPAKEAPVQAPVSNGVVDYLVSAGGNTILHNLLHIFSLFKAKHIDAESLDLRGAGNTPQIHISHDDSDEGTYFMDLVGASYFVRGAYWDGSNWIAKTTEALLIVLNESSGFVFNTATSLTPGNTVSFAQLFNITMAGILIIPTLTASRPLKLNSNKQIISTQIDLASSNDVTNSLGLANGGTAGTNAATARTSLDVYSKAETVTEIGNQLAALLPTVTVNIVAVGNHSHTETGTTTSSNGGHSHTATLSI